MHKLLCFSFLSIFFICFAVKSYGQDLKINEKGDTIIQFNDGSWRYFTLADKTKFADKLNSESAIEAQGLEDLLRLQRVVQEEVHLKTQEVRAINLNRYQLEKSLKETVDEDKIEQLKRKLRLENFNHSKTKSALKSYLELSRLIDNLVPDYTAAKFKKYQKILVSYQTEKGIPISTFEDVAAVDNTKAERVKKTRTKTPRVKEGKNNEKPSRQSIKDLAKAENIEDTKRIKNRKPDKTKIPKVKNTEVATTRSNDGSSIFNSQKNGVSSGGVASVSNSRALNKLPWVKDISVVKHSNCIVSSEAIDDFTRKKRIDLEKQFLFSYTDEKLRPFLKGQELLICEAGLTSLGGFSYLNLSFNIASPNARNNFGVLENNAQISLKLINGNTISLYNSNRDIGKIDPYTGNTIYNGLYIISAANEKLLNKTELDELRVIWSTGYEDYEIYEIDFFINQLTCLQNSKITTDK